METIFFLSAHCGKGPIFAAGSVFVKSGLLSVKTLYQEKSIAVCKKWTGSLPPYAAISLGSEVEKYEEKLTPTYDSPELPCWLWPRHNISSMSLHVLIRISD
jgi:hypothetical protein